MSAAVPRITCDRENNLIFSSHRLQGDFTVLFGTKKNSITQIQSKRFDILNSNKKDTAILIRRTDWCRTTRDSPWADQRTEVMKWQKPFRPSETFPKRLDHSALR